MNKKNDERLIQEKMRKLVADPPSYKLSDEKRRQFIAGLYDIAGERRSLRRASFM